VAARPVLTRPIPERVVVVGYAGSGKHRITVIYSTTDTFILTFGRSVRASSHRAACPAFW